jgi:hypothetical protein
LERAGFEEAHIVGRYLIDLGDQAVIAEAGAHFAEQGFVGFDGRHDGVGGLFRRLDNGIQLIAHFFEMVILFRRMMDGGNFGPDPLDIMK